MQNYKYLIWSGTATLAILSVFLLVNIQHLADTATTTNTISFTGEGKISAIPDIAAVSFSIVTEATTSKAAQDANSTKSKKVVDFLKSQNIEDKDIKTSGYNVYPQYSNNYPKPCPLEFKMMAPEGSDTMPQSYPCAIDNTQKISSYQVNQSFEVKIRDLEKVSIVLDGLVAAGANQVNNLGFKIDDEEKLKDEARTKAIADAQNKAHDLESQLGIRLGKIVNYSEGGSYPGPYFLEAKSADRGGPLPEVPAGENEIVVSVTITYQIR